ncbi:hypothetical protein Csa_006800 [Cucumis sativus]|nr:hypothetical protein Csa_006800 [Cucumis sativus]
MGETIQGPTSRGARRQKTAGAAMERERKNRLAFLRRTAAACDGSSLGADVKEAVDGGDVAWGWWERLRLQGRGERTKERVTLKFRPTS